MPCKFVESPSSSHLLPAHHLQCLLTCGERAYVYQKTPVDPLHLSYSPHSSPARPEQSRGKERLPSDVKTSACHRNPHTVSPTPSPIPTFVIAATPTVPPKVRKTPTNENAAPAPRELAHPLVGALPATDLSAGINRKPEFMDPGAGACLDEREDL
ncbi:hypothetical protein K458DRAFT_404513 [Lentithecium fluviatile CBS 122367]|uniref:Uncharacterized protein n=1 Tax=Lentithecium fluviatile CBS 122367 TaxID=1168545 RepID=A0A6G1J204_9PLEO|nr:hypothetical protein K458DRAFT_404513 [Lentithecium fluviatile CBS 122367]